MSLSACAEDVCIGDGRGHAKGHPPGSTGGNNNSNSNSNKKKKGSNDNNKADNKLCEFVRRSERNPGEALIDSRDVSNLLTKIRGNHSDTVVLKIKDHCPADMHPAVFQNIIDALKANTVCQALYVQNLGSAITDDKLENLTELLKSKKQIWALNIGESYEVSERGWQKFCDQLPETNISHLYASEHTIDIDLKNLMRENIRLNRSKHNLHNSLSNMKVIEKITHMWWNPINFFRHQETNAQKEQERLQQEKERLEQEREKEKIMKQKQKLKEKEKEQREKEREQERQKREKEKQKLRDEKEKEKEKNKTSATDWFLQQNKDWEPVDMMEAMLENPKSTVYWAEGCGGKGGEKPWKFKCSCGEVCSSWENFRYHPIGRQFECGSCGIWAHVACELGKISDDDIEEMGKQVMCKICNGKIRRDRAKELRDKGITLVEDRKTGAISVIYHDNYRGNSATSSAISNTNGNSSGNDVSFDNGIDDGDNDTKIEDGESASDVKNTLSSASTVEATSTVAGTTSVSVFPSMDTEADDTGGIESANSSPSKSRKRALDLL